jgi:drug/metabolite transporter (DMT)-like permease
VGDGLTLIGGFFYAVHIIITARSTKGHNVMILTFVQMATAGVLALASAIIFEPFPTSLPAGSAVAILYLSVMCTAVTFFLQTYGQKHTHPSQAAIILTMESVMGTMLSAFLGQEDLSIRSVAGFVLIFVAVMISETKLDFKRKRTA